MSVTKVSSRADFDRFKTEFQEIMNNIDDVYCHEHTKLKTIYTDKHPNNPSRGGFICDYCNNPSSTMKFYSHILSEYAGVINQIKSAGDLKDDKNLKYKAFVEHCLKLNNEVEDSVDNIHNLIDTFNRDFIPGIYTKVAANEELMKLNEILKTITFNENGKPIYESIGKHPEREKQYVKLANILVAFKGEKFDMNMVFSSSLKQYLLSMLSYRMELIKKSDDFIKFLSGDFYKFIFTQENNNIDYEWLNSLNLKIFSDEEIRQIKATYDATINSQSTEISQLKARYAEMEIELANRAKMNSSLETEIGNLQALNQKWQIRIQQLENEKGGLVQAASNNEQNVQQLNVLRLQYEKRLQELSDKNKELNSLVESYSNDISKLKSQYTLIITENTNVSQAYEIKIREFERKINGLNLDLSNAKSENEKLTVRSASLNEIPELRNQINELIASRKNIIETTNQEKIVLNGQILELERRINEYRARIEYLGVFESNNSVLNSKIIELTSALKNIELKYNTDCSSIQKLTSERDELFLKVNNLSNDFNSFKVRMRVLQDENESLNKNASAYLGLLSDLKKQVSLNKLLESTILSLQEKISLFNSRFSSANEILIKNQLEIIRRYVNETSIIGPEEKNDQLLQENRRETDLIIKKIEGLETNNILSKSVIVPIINPSSTIITTTKREDQRKLGTPMRSYKTTVNNVSIIGGLEGIKLSTSNIAANELIISTITNLDVNLNNQMGKDSKLVYKIDFPTDLILNANYWESIHDWVDATGIFPHSIEPRLLYKASRDGFSAKEFQTRCLSIPNTLVIARTNFGKIIGGFNPLVWSIPLKDFKYVLDESGKTFIFSCSNNEKYELKLNEPAVCYSKRHGPIFGGGSDFEIVDNCNVNYNQASNIGFSFNYTQTPEEFFGDRKYLINDYEVYQLI